MFSNILATKERWFYIAMLFIVPVINTLITSSCQMALTDIGIYIKTMASEAIYRKALVLTSTAKGETSTGQLVNIMFWYDRKGSILPSAVSSV